jgi:rSAM/selenodomain-associated transferase 1
LQKKSKKDGILFFVKYPKIGYVKSRLSSQIDKKFVVCLYKSFVEDILKILKEFEYDILICYYPAEKIENFKRWIGKEYQYLPQNGKDLGERMKNCFIEGFSKGFEKLIVIGSDSPDLPSIIFMDAFHNLEKYDSVIGPCKDGGFYLLGFTNKSFSSTIFSKIPWSTKDVFEKTTDLLKNECVKYFVLPEWQDVDTFDDLKEFYLRNKEEPFKTSQTMMILRKFFQTKNNMF